MEFRRVLFRSLIETSSERYKTNIQDLAPTLPKINSLRPITFNWIDHREQGTQLGLIAEEVYSVVPEAVALKDGQAEAVSYTKLVPVLIKAIQELTAKVEELESKIK